MGSLLLDSLQFLGQHLQAAQENQGDAFDSIRERALRFRMYARENGNEDLLVETTSNFIDESEEISNEYIKCDGSLEGTDNIATNDELNVTNRCLPPIPNIPGVDKEILTNLLMSWFYAGYYTGLAEKKPRPDS
jgi:hypothetical protein